MAKEWYLLSSPTKPNSIGGYENEAFEDYKDDAFNEALETDIATTVVLCNHDLSKSQKIRCIIQGNTGDTQLKSMERIGLFAPKTVKAGMYIFFEDRYWLIDGYPGTQGIYEKATMCLCQYNLKWQNSNGNIIERWCNIQSASKYDVGETGNNVLFLTSNNYTIKITYDEETLNLEEKRVFIDKQKINPKKVFKLTRNDDVLYDYGDNIHGSILSFIADKDELNSKVDNQELRICDYISSTPILPTEEIVVSILGSNTIKIGKPKVWSVSFKDKEGNIIDFDNWTWNIKSDFDTSDFIINTLQETIKITSPDEELLIDESFILQILNNDDEVLAEQEITIVEGW